ncbi:MAG: hypothetical protein AAF995_10120 [Planctomycetota bacterium]
MAQGAGQRRERERRSTTWSGGCLGRALLVAGLVLAAFVIVVFWHENSRLRLLRDVVTQESYEPGQKTRYTGLEVVPEPWLGKSRYSKRHLYTVAAMVGNLEAIKRFQAQGTTTGAVQAAGGLPVHHAFFSRGSGHAGAETIDVLRALDDGTADFNLEHPLSRARHLEDTEAIAFLEQRIDDED